MATWINSGENPNVYLADDDRTVWITDGGIAPAAGAAAYGACDADVALPTGGKVAVCVQLLAVDDSDGTTPLASRCGRLGFVNGDWANLSAVTSSAVLGNAADSWAISGGQDPSDIRDEGSTTFSGAIAVGHEEYVVLLVDVDANKAWAAAAVGGAPGSLTVVSSGDPAAGTTPTWTLHGTGLRVAFSSAGASLRVVGATLLTSEEFDALGITLPSGFSYATDGSSTPDVPTSVAIALDTGTTVDVTWDAGSGDSIELEIRSSLGAFTGTPTHTGLTDDGAHSVDVGGAGTWYVKTRRVVSSVESAWSDVASVTISEMLLVVKNDTTKVAPCGIVATIWDSIPPSGHTMDQTTAYWQWSIDDVLQESLPDRLTLDAVFTDLAGGEVKIECFWYSSITGEAIGYGVETITVAPEPTYDDVMYLDPTTGDDENDGLAEETAKASLGGVIATLDLSANRERLIIVGGSARTTEATEVVNLGVPDGSFIVRGNNVTSVGACVKLQQHGNSDPSRHCRLAFTDLPIDNPNIGGDYGVLDMTYIGGAHASRSRGYDLLWTAPYAYADPDGVTIGISITHVGYIGDSGDYVSPTMDWPGSGDAVLHINEIVCGSPNIYGNMQYVGIRADVVGQSRNHVIRSPRSKAFVFSPLSEPRCELGPQGDTGDHCFKLHARMASATGMGSRLDSWGVDIIDCDFFQQSNGGTSVGCVAAGAQNISQGEFTRGVRLVRPRMFVPDGQTAGGNRHLMTLYASADQVSIYDPIIDYDGQAQIISFSLSRTTAAVDQPDDPALFQHRFSVFGGSLLYVDAAPAIVTCGGGDDLTGHTIHFRLRDIAAKCTHASAIGIELQDNGATVTCDADGIVTDALTFASDEGGAMTLEEFAAAYGGNSRSANVDPEFTDAANGDFTFDSESPLYETGGTEGLDIDVLGNPRTAPRDIGAIEVSSAPSELTAPTSLVGTQVGRTAVVTLTYDTAPVGATGIQARHRYGLASWSDWADLGTPDGSSDMTASAVQTGTLSVEARFTNSGDTSPSTAASVAMLEPAPDTPAQPDLDQVGSSTFARVTITPVARADDGYYIEVSTTGAFGGEETSAGTIPDGSTYLDYDIGAFAVERWFRATAKNAVLGDSSPSASNSITLSAIGADVTGVLQGKIPSPILVTLKTT